MTSLLRKKVVFLSPPNPFLQNQRSVPKIGLLYLAAELLHQGHEVKVIHLVNLNELEELPKDIDFIGISATTREYPSAIQCLNYLKRVGHHAIVSIGGPHATALPNECMMNGFDIVVCGDAENEINRLVCIKKPESPILVRCNSVADIDQIIFPARHVLQEKYSAYTPGIYGKELLTTSILLTRGCPYKCAFCGPHNRYRRRSIENISKEIELIYEAGYRNLIVIDDLPFIKETHVIDFCRIMKRFPGMVFRCNFRGDLFTENIAHMLKQAACKRVQFGIESASDSILNSIKKRASVDVNSNAIKLCRKYGLGSKAMFIWGLPGDNTRTAEAMISWVKSTRPDSIQISNYVPLPGSPLWKLGDHSKVVDYESLSFFDDYPHVTQANRPEIEKQYSLRRYIMDQLSHITHIDRGVDDAIDDTYPASMMKAEAII